MSEQEHSNALVLAHTGELVDLSDVKQVAKALEEVQMLNAKLAEANRRLREAMAEHARIQGTKTIFVSGVGHLEVKGGSVTFYDAEKLEEGLRAAGMPEARIEDMFQTTVSRRARANELKRAAAANPEYAKVIESAKEVREQVPTVEIRS